MAPAPPPDVLGRDLLALYHSGDGRHEDLDLTTAGTPSTGASGGLLPGQVAQDVVATSAVDNATQAVIHRINTVRGELADLGHPEYGSRHHSLIGQPNTARNRNLVKLYVLQALALEPRIRKVISATVDPDPQPDRVTISLALTFIGSPTVTDLVIPFNLAGPA
jgi:phage baseplate assembly protein W